MRRPTLFKSAAASLIAVLAALINGCGSTPPVRFYALSPVSAAMPQGDAADSQHRFTLGVGPVDIPDYLERPHIVVRNGENEMIVAEYERWAGSLKQDIARVLIQNLTVLLPPGASVLSSKRNLPTDYRVSVEVTRLDVIPGRAVVLGAQWAVFGKDRKEHLSLRTRTYTEPLESRDPGTAVSIIGRALGRLSADISGDVEALKTRG